MNMYLVFLVFASRTTSLLVTNNNSVSFYSMQVLPPKLPSAAKTRSCRAHSLSIRRGSFEPSCCKILINFSLI